MNDEVLPESVGLTDDGAFLGSDGIRCIGKGRGRVVVAAVGVIFILVVIFVLVVVFTLVFILILVLNFILVVIELAAICLDGVEREVGRGVQAVGL